MKNFSTVAGGAYLVPFTPEDAVVFGGCSREALQINETIFPQTIS